MVFSDDLPAAQCACSVTLIPLLPVTLLLVIWLLPSHAQACGKAALCGDHIDACFLPLIARSLTGAPAAGAATPVADMPATALPDRPVIIRPPPRTSPPAESGMPGWRVQLKQELVTGRLTDGGHAKLHARTAAVRLRKQGDTGAGQGGSQSGLPALLPDPRIAGIWHMDYGVDTPAFAGWLLGTKRQHLAMRLACHACGHAVGSDRFVGSAWLELTVDELAEGWIEDIELVSAGGRKATGELSFFRPAAVAASAGG